MIYLLISFAIVLHLFTNMCISSSTVCYGNKIITQMCGLLFLGSVSISETAKELNDVYAKTLLTVVSQKAKHAE